MSSRTGVGRRNFGLCYYRARYYDSNAGRFLSEDPINFRAGVNFYLYVYNKPVKLRDPKGKDPVIGAKVGAVLGGIYGGIGAAVDQNASLGDIMAGIGTGALAGGIVGFLDPTLGIGTVAAIGALGDLGGQLASGHGWQKCKPINLGSTLGAAAGAALGAWGGGLLTGGAEGWIATGAKTAITGGPGVFTPGIGANLLPLEVSLVPGDCGCGK